MLCNPSSVPVIVLQLVFTWQMIVFRGWDKLFAVISNNKLAFYKDQKHYKTVCLHAQCSELLHVISAGDAEMLHAVV